METADAAALDVIADDVLSPDVVSLALAKLTKKFAAPTRLPRRSGLGSLRRCGRSRRN